MGSSLLADLAVCGVWMPQVEALFDIRVHVVDTDAKSYGNSAPFDVLTREENE